MVSLKSLDLVLLTYYTLGENRYVIIFSNRIQILKKINKIESYDYFLLLLGISSIWYTELTFMNLHNLRFSR